MTEERGYRTRMALRSRSDDCHDDVDAPSYQIQREARQQHCLGKAVQFRQLTALSSLRLNYPDSYRNGAGEKEARRVIS